MYLTTELIHALPIAERRVYNRQEAASYVGVSPGSFDRWVKEGKMPPALPDARMRRWDKKALDRALDAMGDLPPEIISGPAAALDAWRSARGQG